MNRKAIIARVDATRYIDPSKIR